jgi:hypothetical protein
MELTDDEKAKFLQGIEFIKVNTNVLSKEAVKNTETFLKIEEDLKHINWNLGTIAGALTKDKKLLSEIEEAKAEDKKGKKDKPKN